MFYIAMRMANYEYAPKKTFTDLNAVDNAYDEARYYFSQFGLGANPGIDLPSVATGYIGQVNRKLAGFIYRSIRYLYSTSNGSIYFHYC